MGEGEGEGAGSRKRCGTNELNKFENTVDNECVSDTVLCAECAMVQCYA
jgi:hypothetical protein